MAQQQQLFKETDPGFAQCPNCKKRIRLDSSGNFLDHYGRNHFQFSRASSYCPMSGKSARGGSRG